MMRVQTFTSSASQRHSRRWIVRRLLLGGALVLVAGLAPVAFGQKVAPRLTGAMVLAQLGTARHAVEARYATSHNADVKSVATQLQQMGASLNSALGGDADQPLTTIDKDVRAVALRANAAAARVQAWLKVSAAGCGPGERKAMLAALTLTLKKLAQDTDSQKAPLPVITGVQTLKGRPLFALRAGGKAVPTFVLTGAHFVDPKCANPQVEVFDAKGNSVKFQPQVVAAQAARVQLQWPGIAGLAPGSYVVRLTAQRKRFLFGCGDEPPAIAVLQVMPSLQFVVDYTITARCAGSAKPVTLASGKLSPVSAHGRVASHHVDMATCKRAQSYTLSGSIDTADGHPVSTFGPLTQGAGVTVTTGIGHGLMLRWNPFRHALLITVGGRTCKGLY